MDTELTGGLQESEAAPRLIGHSAAMHRLRALIARYAATPYPIFIAGESGVGKELVARCLHAAGAAPGAPFRALNCAALSPELLEAQLFGAARGAFTGADRDRPGLLAELGQGTLLLDEVGEMPAALQVKLLRLLESGEYYRLGDTRPRQATARVLAASHRDLQQAVARSSFRADLYHRLCVLVLPVPALRERDDDWQLLVSHFCAENRHSFAPFVLTPESRALLAAHPFPGNVRELRNLVVRLGLRHPGRNVPPESLREELAATAGEANAPLPDAAALPSGFRLDEAVARFERGLIHAAITQCQGNLSRAARLLGANRSTLYAKLARHGIALPVSG
jgi:DNA-binding NtrC family response regulator